MRIPHFILFIFFFVSCFQKRASTGNSDAFLPAQRLAELTDKKLEEVSGIAASVSNPGYLWVHNDSGNPAVIYLVNEDLQIQLECKLDGVKNRDWEDIAVGPGPEEGKSYIYVGDIGDNNAKRAVKYIYRFEEPVASGREMKTTITDFDTIAFTLEDGKKDTESLMVHPKTKDIYVVSKREKPVYVYRLRYPFAAHDTLTAQRLHALPLTQIVSAAFSPDGGEVVMKNYDEIYYWQVGKETVESALQQKPQMLKYTEEPQGESVAFNLDGSGFYTLSEKIKGEKTFLYYYPRNNP